MKGSLAQRRSETWTVKGAYVTNSSAMDVRAFGDFLVFFACSVRQFKWEKVE